MSSLLNNLILGYFSVKCERGDGKRIARSNPLEKVIANIRLGHIFIGLAKQKQHIPVCFCKENKEQCSDFSCISLTEQVNHKSEIVTAGQVQLHRSYTPLPPCRGESWRVTHKQLPVCSPSHIHAIPASRSFQDLRWRAFLQFFKDEPREEQNSPIQPPAAAQRGSRWSKATGAMRKCWHQGGNSPPVPRRKSSSPGHSLSLQTHAAFSR